MTVQLLSVTPDAEKLLVYMARVSSNHQSSSEYSKLLRYLVEHKHWSPFEMVHMVVEIVTSRAVAAQLLRHKSFSFQELSQRYTSNIDTPELAEGRKQAEKNRQSSSDPLDSHKQKMWMALQEAAYKAAYEDYLHAINYLGVSREQARMLLPLATPTRLYMAGSARSWIHYIELRTRADTQKEHRDIALSVKGLFTEHFPVTAEALNWTPHILPRI